MIERLRPGQRCPSWTDFRRLVSAGAISVFATVAGAVSSCAPHGQQIHAVKSPDGLMQATTTVLAGGGGISPYCDYLVYVGRAAFSAEQLEEEQYLVFRGDCVTLQSSHDVTWISDSELLIVLSYLDQISTKQKSDKSGRIAITYRQAHKP